VGDDVGQLLEPELLLHAADGNGFGDAVLDVERGEGAV
jgi:hypothetical protein